MKHDEFVLHWCCKLCYDRHELFYDVVWWLSEFVCANVQFHLPCSCWVTSPQVGRGNHSRSLHVTKQRLFGPSWADKEPAGNQTPDTRFFSSCDWWTSRQPNVMHTIVQRLHFGDQALHSEVWLSAQVTAAYQTRPTITTWIGNHMVQLQLASTHITFSANGTTLRIHDLIT